MQLPCLQPSPRLAPSVSGGIRGLGARVSPPIYKRGACSYDRAPPVTLVRGVCVCARV